MAFKMNDRNQQTFLPTVIDNYVGSQDPVRVYDAFVNALDFHKLGICMTPNAGAERYEPKQMVKLIIYGYSYGIRSSRQLERACYHNLSFIWLMADLKPDYRTIARFRSDHKDALKKVFKQCVRMCVDMDLVDGNTLFFDGSKFRANASSKNTLSRTHLEKELKQVEDHIDNLIDESERIDQSENGQSSLVEAKKDLKDKERLASQIKQCLSKINETECPSANITDPDSTNAKTRQGAHAVHNVQFSIEQKHGLIVQADSVSDPNDNNQLPRQLEQAMDNIGYKPQNVCSDAGYFSPEAVQKIDKDITVIMPSPQQAHEDKTKQKIPRGPFDKTHFTYDKEHDEFICHNGKSLIHEGVDTNRPHRHIYRAKGTDCRACSYWETCTTSKNGRRVTRSEYEDIIKRQEEIYKSEHGQTIYRFRKQKAEHPFGHIKRNLNAGQFLLRGREKVNAEVNILATCFNITRMITIVGITQLIANFRG